MDYYNRRKYQRYMMTVAVSVFQGESLSRGTECKNISSGGVMLQLRDSVKMDKLAVIAITEKCGDMLINFSAQCRVVWQECNNSGETFVGLEFLKMDQQNARSLSTLLTYAQACGG